MTEINKSTFNAYKTELFAPIMKTAEGKYLAILSDTSVDRDGERVGKAALMKIKTDQGYLAALIDHENKALGQVARWINRDIKDIDGHTALVAEPKFFESNPNAVIIRGMLDEGAQFGISIGAMVKDFKEEKIEGKSMRTYTDLELLEASFVAIPSNKHGRCLAVAKSFNLKNKEESQMAEEELQKSLDESNKKVDELQKSYDDLNKSHDELKKAVEEKDSEISKLKKELEESDKKCDDKEKEAEEAKDKAAEAEKALDAEKNKSLEKAKLTEEPDESGEDVDKSIKEGKLPIMRF